MPAGTVLEQGVTAFTEMPVNSEIDLIVSLGPPETEPPETEPETETDEETEPDEPGEETEAPDEPDEPVVTEADEPENAG